MRREHRLGCSIFLSGKKVSSKVWVRWVLLRVVQAPFLRVGGPIWSRWNQVRRRSVAQVDAWGRTPSHPSETEQSGQHCQSSHCSCARSTQRHPSPRSSPPMAPQSRGFWSLPVEWWPAGSSQAQTEAQPSPQTDSHSCCFHHDHPEQPIGYSHCHPLIKKEQIEIERKKSVNLGNAKKKKRSEMK